MSITGPREAMREKGRGKVNEFVMFHVLPGWAGDKGWSSIGVRDTNGTESSRLDVALELAALCATNN